jgi:hypothetical protein
MAYDATTYTPGDPWTSSDFISSAIVPPKLLGTWTDATDITELDGAATEGTYFDYRTSKNKGQALFTVVLTFDPAPNVTVNLEASIDDGSTWAPVSSFTGPVCRTFEVEANVKYRLRLMEDLATGKVVKYLLTQTR